MLISILLLAFLINYVSAKNLIATFLKINLIYFIPAFLLVLANVFILYKKWFAISKQVLNLNDKKKILDSLLQGFAAGIITPFRFGEYLARNITLQADTLKVVLATFFDKIFNLIIILFLGSISVILLLLKLQKQSVALIVTFSIFVLAFLLLMIITNLKIRNYLVNQSSVQKSFLSFRLALAEYTRYNSFFYLRILLLSLIHYFVVIVQYVLILKSFSAGNSIFNLTWYSALLLFGKSVIPPISFGEVGIREASSIFFASFFQIDNSVGFNSSIIIFVINLIIPALFGMLFSLRGKK